MNDTQQTAVGDTEDQQFVFIKLVNFKSPRLFLLLLVIPYFVLFYFAVWDFGVVGVIDALRRLISFGGLLGCLFYAIGARVFNRKFWQVYFVILVLDELVGLFEEPESFDFTSVLLILPIFVLTGLYAFHNQTIWQTRSTKTLHPKKTWVISALSALAAVIIASITLTLWHLGFSTVEVQPTEAERAAILKIEDFADQAPGFVPVQSAAILTKSEYTNDPGRFDLDYRYQQMHQDKDVFLSVTFFHATSAEDAQGSYEALKAFHSLSFRGTELHWQDDLLRWGDESKFAEFPAFDGHFLLARQGSCVIFVMHYGIQFDSTRAFSKFVLPHLENMSTLGC